jgi:hypothetical protein
MFTGERLTLCLDCVDHKAEPLWSIVHGVNADALDNLPEWVKVNVTFYDKGRYIPMRTLARINMQKLLPPPKEKQLVDKMRRMADLPPERPPTMRERVLSILRRMPIVSGRFLRA